MKSYDELKVIYCKKCSYKRKCRTICPTLSSQLFENDTEEYYPFFYDYFEEDKTAKNTWVKIRCTESQREYIKKKAKEKDMSISEYIRYLLQNDTATTI